ncbi:hypothetical protein BCR43DRAFT_503105 [Syncephalastrum racemosum]|uniref:Uncharacterized protein n=1 Tax=Syncephalastrum racemosum TaxID=13706 RepID=A0A1X2HRP8_SYNRA|nr:hypothetical protein BCR43DRAFT_503105 [Syncephalastrum racemosum]
MPLREKLLCAIEEVRFLAEKLAESERRAKAMQKECIQTRDQLGIFVVENEVLRRDLERIKLALHESESLRHQRKERFLFPFPNRSWDSDICRKTDTFPESRTTYYRTVPTSIKQLFKPRDPVYRNL